jgi:hypothetical protein
MAPLVRECAARADQNGELVRKIQMIKALIFSLSPVPL